MCRGAEHVKIRRSKQAWQILFEKDSLYEHFKLDIRMIFKPFLIELWKYLKFTVFTTAVHKFGFVII